jgi:hypothetical protein|tara:strand:+ start:811 stop:3183 length:2373 start_codon:yes stop_codon:yes gene_type:complete
MASTYSNDLRVEEQAVGENSGTWGTKVNATFSQIADGFSYGTKAMSADANETFTMADGTADATRSLYLKITSSATLTATRTITLGPNTVSKLWLVENATTGSQSIIIKQGTGATVTVASGGVRLIYTDGAGSGAAVVDAFTDLATSGTLTAGGVLTANAGVVIDNITIDGTEIDLSSGDLTLDVAGDINLDAAGNSILFKSAGTHFGDITKSGSDLYLNAVVSDGDVYIRGNDGGATITALQLDMSAAGNAIFNGNIKLADSKQLQMGADADFILYHDGTSNYIQAAKQDSDIILRGNDGGSGVNMLTLDTSAAGLATFNAGATFGGNIGIGTSSPGNIIEVAGASPIVEINSTSGNPELQFSDGGTDEFSIMYDTGANALKIVEGGVGTQVSILDGGNVGIGSTNPQNVLDLGSGTAGRGIAWGYTNGTAHYNTIWSEYGTASIVVGAGLKGSTSASTFLNPFTGTYGYAAIELDNFSDDGIKFYVGADASRTKDAAITPSEVMRIATNGTVGIGTTAPAYTLDVDSTIHIGSDGGSGYTQSRLIFEATSNARGLGSFYFNQDTDLEWFAGNPYNDSDSFSITRQATTSHTGATASYDLALMTIDGPTGNMGIGLTAPTSRLHVNDDTNDGYVARFSQDHATGYGVLIDVDGTDNADPALRVDNAAGTVGLFVSQAGNVGINNTAPTQKLDVTGNIALHNGTAPASSETNGVVLYAEDVSSSSELKVRDEAGNVTTLSPHNFDLIPEGPSEDMAWSYFSEKDGKRINVDMLKAIRVLEKMSGEKLVFES